MLTSRRFVQAAVRHVALRRGGAVTASRWFSNDDNNKGKGAASAAGGTAPTTDGSDEGSNDSSDKKGDEISLRDVFSPRNRQNPAADSDNNRNDDDDAAADFFGGSFEDGPDKLGPHSQLPPRYVRDATTGRLTGQIASPGNDDDNDNSGDHTYAASDTLTEAERQLLQISGPQTDAALASRVEKYWKSLQQEGTETSSADKDGEHEEDSMPLAAALGQRIRQAQRDLNVLGRSPAAQATSSATQPKPSSIPTTQRLSPQEMKEFQAYMKEHHRVELDTDDMPVAHVDNRHNPEAAQAAAAEALQAAAAKAPPHTKDWAVQWRTEQAQREVEDFLDDNPYVDIMPPDLSANPLVNRKNAKRLPHELLAYNNTALLQSFITETGQIKSRIQTRLGARDQRKVAKLIRRARALGLVPYQAPFCVEQHGWKNDPTLQGNSQPAKRPWEIELKRRGLVINRDKAPLPSLRSWLDDDEVEVAGRQE